MTTVSSFINNNNNEYSTLLPPSNDDNIHATVTIDSSSSSSSFSTKKKKMIIGLWIVLIVGSFVVYSNNNNNSTTSSSISSMIFSKNRVDNHHHSNHQEKDNSKQHTNTIHNNEKIPMPYGVNFGSWLSLEDYFFTGDRGAIQVATPVNKTAAICLPPLHTGTSSSSSLPKWNSETDLLHNLISKMGIRHALQMIQAHRNTFITEDDLIQLQSWGIRHVRIPLSWCWTSSSYEEELRNHHHTRDDDYLLQQFTCQDPYHKDTLWPAISKPWLASFLQMCAEYDISASLDLHTYPGGTSPGTFSGVWPKPPLFWQHTSTDHIGLDLFQSVVTWVETLPSSVRKGILAISPMNEPAHLAGIFRNGPDDFLPPLSPSEASDYLQKVNHAIPDGPHLRVLSWLDQAMDIFRQSKLLVSSSTSTGIQLHVNVHESVLSAQVLEGNDDLDMGGRHPFGTKVFAAWWSQVTTKEERSSWAVLDMHHYHAWEPSCQGSVVGGGDDSNYTCRDVTARRDALTRCASWATDVYRPIINEYCGSSSGSPAQLMSGEFSTSTHYRVRHACQDVHTLRDSYLYQIQAAKNASINLFYWSYKMPYGGLAKNAWSFQQLLYDISMMQEGSTSSGGGGMPYSKPDISNIPCTSNEGKDDDDSAVTDDWF